jgi:hypothetical protein
VHSAPLLDLGLVGAVMALRVGFLGGSRGIGFIMHDRGAESLRNMATELLLGGPRMERMGF